MYMVNWASGAANVPRGVATWRCTLARWHQRQARGHFLTSILMPGHTYVPAGHKTCGTNARVRNRVQRIENRPAEMLRDVRVLDASGDVTDNRDSLGEERDTLEAEGRIRTQPG